VDPATLAGFFATLFCTWIAPSTTTLPVTLSANFGTTSTSELEFVSPGGVNAFGVRVVYESTDLIISSAATVTIPPTSVPVSTLLPAVPTSPPAVSTSPASTGSTSTGTIVIAVVILVVALAVLGAVYMWWRKRRRQREPQGITSEVYAGPKGELAGSPTKFLNYAHATPAELPIDGSG
jgi:hypothetical protein